MTKKVKTKSCLFASVSQLILNKIITLKSLKEIWNCLKVEYEGNKNIQCMNVLNLISEFEPQQMKEFETINKNSNKLLDISRKIKLLENEFRDSILISRIMVMVLERYEALLLR